MKNDGSITGAKQGNISVIELLPDDRWYLQWDSGEMPDVNDLIDLHVKATSLQGRKTHYLLKDDRILRYLACIGDSAISG